MKVETLSGEFDIGDSAFLDSAAAMKCVDLVITSDTALTHLAGALGVQTWLPLQHVPDWRWLLDRDDTPWYPNHRLFRQKIDGDWVSVFDEMEKELKTLISIKNTKQNHQIFANPLAPISWGELVDKITILEIKQVRIKSQSALVNIIKELGYLNEIFKNNASVTEIITDSKRQLLDVNKQLWQVEDDIRDKEINQEFDNEFIELARKVYRLNDSRAKIKKTINQVLNSELIEEKSYKDFQ